MNVMICCWLVSSTERVHTGKGYQRHVSKKEALERNLCRKERKPVESE